jgi:hypothetical protein
MADYTRQEVFFAKENERPNASTGYMLFLRTIPLLARHRSAHPPTHVHFAAVIFQSHRRHNIPRVEGSSLFLGVCTNVLGGLVVVSVHTHSTAPQMTG